MCACDVTLILSLLSSFEYLTIDNSILFGHDDDG
jgi:hypothetical protein